MDFVKDHVGGDPARAEALRVATLDEIGSKDPEKVKLALLCLMVVGQKNDVPILTPLDDHEDERIRRAVKACSYAMKRNG